MRTQKPFLRCLVVVAFALGALSMTATDVAAHVPNPTEHDLHPSRRPSPMAMARTTIGDAYVFVVYSRPYKRGRDNIFGTAESEALVPYGQVWRTGANEATQITTTGDLVVAGESVPAGTYSLFTTPGPEEWTIHFNSELGMSGTGRFDPETQSFTQTFTTDNDVIAVTVPSESLDEEVGQFTIAFEESEAGAELVLKWIDTAVRIPMQPAD